MNAFLRVSRFLLFLGFGAQFLSISAQAGPTNLTQLAFVKASNTGANDQLGNSVAISGNTMVVGALQESGSSSGVNGPDNDSLFWAGAAYVYVSDGTNWTQQAYLKASNPDSQDFFGGAVAISGDTIVVGAYGEASNATGVNGDQGNGGFPGMGAAYVFVRSGETWSQQAYLKASNPGQVSFGWSVAISSNTIVVGATGESSAATGVNGNQIVSPTNAATASGAAYVFVRSGSTWSQQAYLKASNTGNNDHFGQSVAVDADTIIIGAEGERSNADGINGDQADNSFNNVGAAYIFNRTGTNWSQQAYVKASNSDANDNFGWTVAISGDTAIVGAHGEASAATGVNGNQTDNSAGSAGAAYVFTRSGATWSQQAYLKASNAEAGDTFGWSVSVDGDHAVVGAIGEDSGIVGDQNNNDRSGSGAGYVFTRSGGTWTQQAYLKANPQDFGFFGDLFGNAVAISGDLVGVGAYWEDSDATGINGDPDNNSASQSGAAYIFGNAPPTPPSVPPSIVSISFDPFQVTLECLGDPDASYSIERRPDFDNGWGWIGYEVAQPDGTFFFYDFDVLPDSAFYRLVKE
jgi:hypothetical protein